MPFHFCHSDNRAGVLLVDSSPQLRVMERHREKQLLILIHDLYSRSVSGVWPELRTRRLLMGLRAVDGDEKRVRT
jgi:hypothetical protein